MAGTGGKPGEVREQEVSLLELFYDLIFVYAISAMTSILEGVELGPRVFFHYFIASFVVLQAWMYMTNYVNRFGQNRVHEKLGMVVNMCAAVYMSDAIASTGDRSLLAFNASMFVMSGVVAVLYALHLRGDESSRTMAQFSLRTLVPMCAIYLFVALASGVLDARVALVLDVVAILFGAFGPRLVNHGMNLDLSMISFPHLTERFELITIITFGEAIVTVARVFQASGFSLDAILTFAAIIALFGCYVVQAHFLVEHKQVRRGLRLIYCHFFIVIAVNFFTVSLNLLLEESGEVSLAACVIADIALFVFFLCLFLLSSYHREGLSFDGRDWAVLWAFVVAGCALTFAGLAGGLPAFLCGPLLASAGCFWYLRRKDLATRRR